MNQNEHNLKIGTIYSDKKRPTRYLIILGFNRSIVKFYHVDNVSCISRYCEEDFRGFINSTNSGWHKYEPK